MNSDPSDFPLYAWDLFLWVDCSYYEQVKQFSVRKTIYKAKLREIDSKWVNTIRLSPRFLRPSSVMFLQLSKLRVIDFKALSLWRPLLRFFRPSLVILELLTSKLRDSKEAESSRALPILVNVLSVIFEPFRFRLRDFNFKRLFHKGLKPVSVISSPQFSKSKVRDCKLLRFWRLSPKSLRPSSWIFSHLFKYQ